MELANSIDSATFVYITAWKWLGANKLTAKFCATTTINHIRIFHSLHLPPVGSCLLLPLIHPILQFTGWAECLSAWHNNNGATTNGGGAAEGYENLMNFNRVSDTSNNCRQRGRGWRELRVKCEIVGFNREWWLVIETFLSNMTFNVGHLYYLLGPVNFKGFQAPKMGLSPLPSGLFVSIIWWSRVQRIVFHESWTKLAFPRLWIAFRLPDLLN